MFLFSMSCRFKLKFFHICLYQMIFSYESVICQCTVHWKVNILWFQSKVDLMKSQRKQLEAELRKQVNNLIATSVSLPSCANVVKTEVSKSALNSTICNIKLTCVSWTYFTYVVVPLEGIWLETRSLQLPSFCHTRQIGLCFHSRFP